MSTKDIVIPIDPSDNPVPGPAPTPTPTPTPTPAPAHARIDVAHVKQIIDLLVKILSTATKFTPGQLGDTLKKVETFVLKFVNEPWFAAAVAEVVDLLTGSAPVTIEEIIKAISGIFLKHAVGF